MKLINRLFISKYKDEFIILMLYFAFAMNHPHRIIQTIVAQLLPILMSEAFYADGSGQGRRNSSSEFKNHKFYSSLYQPFVTVMKTICTTFTNKNKQQIVFMKFFEDSADFQVEG